MLPPKIIVEAVKFLVAEEHIIKQKIVEYAKQNYETYNLAVGGVAWNNDPLPNWEDFYNDPTKQKQVYGWLATGLNLLLLELRTKNQALLLDTNIHKDLIKIMLNYEEPTNTEKN